MATLNFGIATTNVNTGAAGYRTKWIRHNPTTIVCIGTGPVGPLSWVIQLISN
jgi:hypothetical protein